MNRRVELRLLVDHLYPLWSIARVLSLAVRRRTASLRSRLRRNRHRPAPTGSTYDLGKRKIWILAVMTSIIAIVLMLCHPLRSAGLMSRQKADETSSTNLESQAATPSTAAEKLPAASPATDVEAPENKSLTGNEPKEPVNELKPEKPQSEKSPSGEHDPATTLIEDETAAVAQEKPPVDEKRVDKPAADVIANEKSPAENSATGSPAASEPSGAAVEVTPTPNSPDKSQSAQSPFDEDLPKLDPPKQDPPKQELSKDESFPSNAPGPQIKAGESPPERKTEKEASTPTTDLFGSEASPQTSESTAAAKPAAPPATKPDEKPAEKPGPMTRIVIAHTPLVRTGDQSSYKVVIRNVGQSAVAVIEIDEATPTGHIVQSVNPPADPGTGGLHWTLQNLAAGEERVITITISPPAVTPLAQQATQSELATPKKTAASSTTQQSAKAAPPLRLELIMPRTVSVGSKCRVGFRASNLGSKATHLKIDLDVPAGLKFKIGQKLVYDLGTLEENQSREDYLTVLAVIAGPATMQGQILADGHPVASSTTTCQVLPLKSAQPTPVRQTQWVAHPTSEKPPAAPPASTAPCICWP